MMVNSLDISTLVAQIPEAQKIHNVHQIHPEAQQLVAQEHVLRKQKQEQQQVAKPEQAASQTNVDKEGGGAMNQEYQPHGKKREKKPEEFENTGGHLIDMDV